MRELLRTLAEHLIFLLDPGGYRLAGSEVGSAFGDAWTTLESDHLIWRLVRDRSQIFLECRERGGPDDRWYSTDLLIRLVTEQKVESAELTPQTAAWIEEHLPEIEARFGSDEIEGTIRQLQALKRQRAKELFG